MTVDKGYVSGSGRMLVLKLLSEKSQYGYEMIKTLKQRSNDVFEMTYRAYNASGELVAERTW